MENVMGSFFADYISIFNIYNLKSVSSPCVCARAYNCSSISHSLLIANMSAASSKLIEFLLKLLVWLNITSTFVNFRGHNFECLFELMAPHAIRIVVMVCSHNLFLTF